MNLLVTKGPNIGVKYTLGDVTTIGRTPENTIQILDASVSRLHCEIIRQGRRFVLRDRESRNGIKVNGIKVDVQTLTSNDEISIGTTSVLFDTSHDLKNTRFSNKRVHFSSPSEETIVRLDSREMSSIRIKSPVVRAAGQGRDLLRTLGGLFSSSQLPMPEALERILQILLKLFDAECGCLMKWDAVLEDFVPLVVISGSDEFSVSRNVIKCIQEEKRAVLIPAREPSEPGDNTDKDSHDNFALCVPFLREQNVTGLIYLEISDSDQILLNDVQLLESVATLTQLAIEYSRTLDELEVERSQSRKKDAKLVGESVEFRKVIQLVHRVAATSSTVLLTGETGTGKEMIAHEIHRRSKRSPYRFMAINCAAISENIIESELFGHERGAFTGAERMRRGLFETAHGGTLLLDEIGEMDMSAQTKLLRFLQDHVIMRVGGSQPISVDVRVIAATNIDLAEAVKKKRFREDLWYRLNVFEINLPPLRNRRGDIMPLARHFLRRYGAQYNKPILGFSDVASRVLEAYDWPGNVREMQNAIERSVLLCDGGRLEPKHFSTLFANLNSDKSVFRKEAASSSTTQSADQSLTLTLAEAEMRCIVRALDSTKWNQVEAAGVLGIHRNTLRKKIQEYNLKQEE